METQIPEAVTCPNCLNLHCEVEVVEDRRISENKVVLLVLCPQCAMNDRLFGTVTIIDNQQVGQ